MKLKNAINSWTILIPSLVLNAALLGAMAFFLNQMELAYQREVSRGPLLNARIKSMENAAHLAAHTVKPVEAPVIPDASPQ